MSITKNSFVSDFLSQWILKSKNKVKQSTYGTYINLINRYILPYLGGYTLVQLNDGVITQYINTLLLKGRTDGKGGLSPQTVNDIITVLKPALEFLKSNYNLCHDIKLERVKERRKEIVLIPEPDYFKLENYCLNRRSSVTFGILIMLVTGIRIGELCALQIRDIDFNSGILKITKTLQRIKDTSVNTDTKTKVIIDTPKSEYSIRDIPLVSYVYNALKEHYIQYPDHYYILTENNSYMEPRCFRYNFDKLIRNLRISKINVHSLRHLFANRALKNGMDIKTLSEIMGHSSVKITMDLYIHSSLDSKRKAIELMDRKTEKMA